MQDTVSINFQFVICKWQKIPITWRMNHFVYRVSRKAAEKIFYSSMCQGILRVRVFRYNERSSNESRHCGEVIRLPPAINQSSSTLLRGKDIYRESCSRRYKIPTKAREVTIFSVCVILRF